ncbi:TPA: protein phosphatase 2C domain-containing protein [Aeromonas dhakensis]|nr:protein phosphatase 2C domain-containing protein [Aeromonas dhakensis]
MTVASYYQPLLPQLPHYLELLAATPLPLSDWHGVASQAIGYRHLQHGVPCQDHGLVHCQGRPLLVLCDGAGSAPCAEVGAHSLSEGMRRLLISLEPLLGHWLDQPAAPDELAQLAMLLVLHAKGINADLGATGRRSGDDFRSTLLLAVAGRHRVFWLQVGDGLLALRERGYPGSPWRQLGKASKGEFANQTAFIDPQLSFAQVTWGTEPAGRVEAVVAMSDGAAERLYSSAESRFAPLLDQWVEQQATGRELYECLSQSELWRRTTGDDKSVALLVAPIANAV